MLVTSRVRLVAPLVPCSRAASPCSCNMATWVTGVTRCRVTTLHTTCWVPVPRLRRMARPHLGITGDQVLTTSDQVLTSSDPGILMGCPDQELTTSDHSHYSGMRV